MKEPQHSCPHIDEILFWIKGIQHISKSLDIALRKNDDPENVETVCYELIDHLDYANDVADHLDDIRNINSDLRAFAFAHESALEDIEATNYELEKRIEELESEISTLEMQLRES
jgi:hypothetical protein